MSLPILEKQTHLCTKTRPVMAIFVARKFSSPSKIYDFCVMYADWKWIKYEHMQNNRNTKLKLKLFKDIYFALSLNLFFSFYPYTIL